MSDSPGKENNGEHEGKNTSPMVRESARASELPATRKAKRLPLPFTILIILLACGIVLFAVLFALQFIHTRNLGETGLSGNIASQQNQASDEDGTAPVSILPEEPGGITILEKQAETSSGSGVVPAAPVAQGAGIATGFAMDLGAADSFIELTQRFAAIVAENGENNFLRLEPRAVLRETVNGLEARLLVGPFSTEAEAADACEVLVLDDGLACSAQPFEGELIARQ